MMGCNATEKGWQLKEIYKDIGLIIAEEFTIFSKISNFNKKNMNTSFNKIRKFIRKLEVGLRNC